MDPITALNCWIYGYITEWMPRYRRDYNAWINKGGFAASVKVWSNRVMGVPVDFQVTKIGTKLLHGTMYYNGVTWNAKLPRERVVGYNR